jgi:hypothetical protein
MTDHESALQLLVLERLKGDVALKALLGDPPRIWDQAPGTRAFPHLLLGRGESRLVPADECGVEHVLTLTCVSEFGGVEEAKAIAAAVRARLHEATLTGDGVRTVSMRVTFSDVFRASDHRRVLAVMRVRAVTEDV